MDVLALSQEGSHCVKLLTFDIGFLFPISKLPQPVRQRWQEYKQGAKDEEMIEAERELLRLQDRLQAAERKRLRLLEDVRRRAGARSKRAMKARDALRASQDQQREKRLQSKSLAAIHSVQLDDLTMGQQDFYGMSTSQRRKLAAFKRDLSTRRLQRSWREFCRKQKSTFSLTRAFVNTGVTGLDLPPQLSLPPHATTTAAAPAATTPAMAMMGGMSSGQSRQHTAFEQFASKLQSPTTLRAAQALLRRLEVRLAAKGVGSEGPQALLRRLFPRAPADKPIDRYPVRVFLCAYMVLQHPQVVFNGGGEIESRLSAAAQAMINSFEALLKRVLDPLPDALLAPEMHSSCSSPRTPQAGVGSASSSNCPSPLNLGIKQYRKHMERSYSSPVTMPAEEVQQEEDYRSIGQLLVTFDDLYMEYLDLFIVWKSHDASSLEHDLILMAVKLEQSLLRKLGPVNGGAAKRVRAEEDLQAMVAQVRHDHQLLKERIQRLGGLAGVAKLEAALARAKDEVHAEFAAAAAWNQDDSLRSSSDTEQSDQQAPRELLDAAEPSAQEAASIPEPAPQHDNKEQMVWEMMYNPQYKLSTAEAEAAWNAALNPSAAEDMEEDQDPESMSQEQLLALLQRRAKAVAERAFWDSIQWRMSAALQGTASLASQLAPLVSELGLDLAAAVADERRAGELQQQFSEARVAEELTLGTGQVHGVSGAALGTILDRLGQLLLQFCAPVRAEEARAAFTTVRSDLAAAMGRAATGQIPAADVAGELAPLLTRAIKLLQLQMRLLKLDSANSRLGMLAQALQEDGAANYLRMKFAALHKLPVDSTDTAALSAALPNTSQWLKAASQSLPELQRALSAASIPTAPAAPSPSSSSSPSSSLPANMRTGVASSRSPSTSGTAAAASASAAKVQPCYPVQLASWRGTFRAALLAAITGDVPASGPQLAELLRHDRERLHAAQNAFQQLLVLSAGLLIVQQLRQQQGLAWSAAQRDAARRRLLVVLADPAMKLSDLVTELAQLSSDSRDGGMALEQQVQKMFVSIVEPSSGPYRSIRQALGSALLAHLLHGGVAVVADVELSRAVVSVLGKVGASVLVGDVAALAAQVAQVAAVNEAVHEGVLAALC